MAYGWRPSTASRSWSARATGAALPSITAGTSALARGKWTMPARRSFAFLSHPTADGAQHSGSPARNKAVQCRTQCKHAHSGGGFSSGFVTSISPAANSSKSLMSVGARDRKTRGLQVRLPLLSWGLILGDALSECRARGESALKNGQKCRIPQAYRAELQER